MQNAFAELRRIRRSALLPTRRLARYLYYSGNTYSYCHLRRRLERQAILGTATLLQGSHRRTCEARCRVDHQYQRLALEHWKTKAAARDIRSYGTSLSGAY